MRLSRDYHVVMTTVGIGRLKARLSAYLREVRRGGTVVVLDRSTPVARIVPYEEVGEGLSVLLPRPGTPPLREMPAFEPLDLDVDPVELLLEDRRGGR